MKTVRRNRFLFLFLILVIYSNLCNVYARSVVVIDDIRPETIHEKPKLAEINSTEYDLLKGSVVIIEDIRPETIQEKPKLAEINSTEYDLLKAYENNRTAIIEAEQLLAAGGHLNLTERELQVNKIFMLHKSAELWAGFQNDSLNAPGLHFFKAKSIIDESKVLKFLQKMPKGAILHLHNTASVSSKWIIDNLSYLPGMKQCTTMDNYMLLTFRESADHNCRTPYRLIQDERNEANDSKAYDKELESNINMYTEFPEVDYSSVNKAWERFQNIFDGLGEAIKYLPAYKLFHWRMLEELYQDKVMYAEIRMRFKELYDNNGTTFGSDESLDILYKLVEDFKNLHSDFLGIKVIYSINRGMNRKKLKRNLDFLKQIHSKYPQFVAGFDLVGQEDKGSTLYNLLDVLREVPRSIKFFFHAGETNWYGTSTDMNLLDAILMNTTRIGHGYALLKHPVLSELVKERDIALEVSPISNQVLHLVTDLRNHPGGFFMAYKIPIVVTNDDPGFWNAKGLSYDFYYAIMSFAPQDAGLKTLKYLVWNSIHYSAMSGEEKQVAYERLQKDWDDFIEEVLFGKVV